MGLPVEQRMQEMFDKEINRIINNIEKELQRDHRFEFFDLELWKLHNEEYIKLSTDILKIKLSVAKNLLPQNLDLDQFIEYSKSTPFLYEKLERK